MDCEICLGFIEYFEQMQIEYPNKSIEFVRVISENDLVALHTHQIWPDNDEKALTFGKSTEYYMKIICHFERSFLSITPSFGQARKEKKKKVKQTYMPLEDLIK